MQTAEQSSTPHYDRWERLRAEPWTAKMRAFAKKANTMVCTFVQVPDAPSWLRDACFVNVRMVRTRKNGVEETFECTFPGFIRGGTRDATRTVPATEYSFAYEQYSDESNNVYCPTTGVWVLHFYPGQRTPTHTAVLSIPTGSTLTFYVRLDWHTSPILVDAQLHGDALSVDFRGKREGSFELDHTVTRHNSVRFGHS